MNEDTFQTTIAAAVARLGPARKRWAGYLTPHGAALWSCGCCWHGADGAGHGLLHACREHAEK